MSVVPGRNEMYAWYVDANFDHPGSCGYIQYGGWRERRFLDFEYFRSTKCARGHRRTICAYLHGYPCGVYIFEFGELYLLRPLFR
jgi:hypothetical protein